MIPVSAAARRSILKLAFGAVLVAALARADQPIPRIVVLLPASMSRTDEEGLREGFRDLGYVEGRNILVDWRRLLGTSAETDEKLRELVTGLERAGVNVVVVFSTPAARAALSATKIPVVFLVGDPVGTGLAASLSHPGGNGTGVSMLMPEMVSKRVELLLQLSPGIRRIVFLTNSYNPLNTRMLEEAQRATRELGVELMTLDARNTDELEAVLRSMPRGTTDGLVVGPDLLLFANKARVAQAVRKARLAAIFPYRTYHDDGVLMSYGGDVKEAAHKLAGYVDKILKGAKPSELPIEQMSKYELIIDLRLARAMGVHVPPGLLERADEVIR